jgi:hypothetical protein
MPSLVGPAPTDVSTATPAPTAISTLTVEPTGKPADENLDGGFSIQSIVTGSGCEQTSTTDVVSVGDAVEFLCDGEVGPESDNTNDVTRTFSNLTSGWQYQLNNGAWRSTVTSPQSDNEFTAFTVRLRPTSAVSPGTSGFITVSLTTSDGISGYTTTLGATRAQATPVAADLQLVCSPSPVTVNINQPQTVNCTYSGRSTLGTRQVMLTQIVVQAPNNWTIAGSVGTVSNGNRRLTIGPNAVISFSPVQSYQFSYTLTPSCSASASNQSVAHTSQFSFNSSTGNTGAAFTGQVARGSTPLVSVSVISSTLGWSQPVTFSNSTVIGNMAYQVTSTSCTGWNVTVTASPFVYSGGSGGSNIPASSFNLTSSTNPTSTSGSLAGVSRQTTTGGMNTTIKVLRATNGNGIGSYQQTLNFSLTIPAQSRAGSYLSTITLTTAAAP